MYNSEDPIKNKPKALPVIQENIPYDLKQYPHWVCWGYRWKPKKTRWDKIPINPRTLDWGSSTDPTTWATYEKALTRLNQFQHGEIDEPLDGIGIVMTRDGPLVGVDWDDNVTEGKGLKNYQEVHDLLSYTERSPSGRGTRVIVRADLPDDGLKDDEKGIEIYKWGRFLTITGHRFSWSPVVVASRQAEIDKLVKKYFPPEKRQKARAEHHEAIDPAPGRPYAEWSADEVMTFRAKLEGCSDITLDRSAECWHLVCWAIEHNLAKQDVWRKCKDFGRWAEEKPSYFERAWTKASMNTEPFPYFKPLQSIPVEEVEVPAKPAPTPPVAQDFVEDARTRYLWQGNHANAENVTEPDRLARAKSVLDAYALLPPSGCLYNFLQTFLPTTDLSPRLFLGTALSLFASVLGRAVWVDNGGRKVYPALWVALIAQSGERKSTGVNLLKGIMHSDPELAARLWGEDTTWASMASQLGVPVERTPDGEWDWRTVMTACQTKGVDWGKGVATFAIDEIAGWVKKLDQQYNAGLKELLTGSYEGLPYIQKSTLENAYLVWKPTINLLGASTPAWLAANTTERDVQGGFLGRWTFFISPGRDYILPRCDRPDEEARGALLLSLERLKRCRGEVAFTNEAWDTYSRWMRTLTYDERIASWGNRLGNIVIKFALIFTLTERGVGPAQAVDVERACRLVSLLLHDLTNYVEWELPVTKEEANVVKVYKLILRFAREAPNGAPHQKVMYYSKLTASLFREVINTLIERGTILRTSVDEGRHRPVFYQTLPLTTSPQGE